MKGTITTIALAALLCAAVGAYAALGGPERATPSLAGADASSPLRLSGRVTGLYPGAPAQLNATAHNTTDTPLRLMWVKTRVRAASPDCGRENLHAFRIRPGLLIPPHARRAVQIPVELSATAPDSCQAGLFPLRFRTRTGPPRRTP